jgi:hypothetical protein
MYQTTTTRDGLRISAWPFAKENGQAEIMIAVFADAAYADPADDDRKIVHYRATTATPLADAIADAIDAARSWLRGTGDYGRFEEHEAALLAEHIGGLEAVL